MSGRGSTKSERYLPTTNEKPSETMFQRVLLDFVLKTFGLGAENEPRARIRGHFSRTCIYTPYPPDRGYFGVARANHAFRSKSPLYRADAKPRAEAACRLCRGAKEEEQRSKGVWGIGNTRSLPATKKRERETYLRFA